MRKTLSIVALAGGWDIHGWDEYQVSSPTP